MAPFWETCARKVCGWQVSCKSRVDHDAKADVVPSPAFAIQNVGMEVHQIAMVWEKECARALSKISRLELTRTLESAITGAPGQGLFAATRAAQMLADKIPCNPVVTLTFCLESDNANSLLLKECPSVSGTLILSVKVAKTGDKLQTAAFLTVPIQSPRRQFQIDEIGSLRPDYILAGYKFSLRCMDAIGDVNEDVACSASRVRNVVEAHIAPIIQGQSANSLDDLAYRCARAIMQISQPLAGLLHFGAVRVKLHAVVDGEVVKRAKRTVDNTPETLESVQKSVETVQESVDSEQEAVESEQKNVQPVQESAATEQGAVETVRQTTRLNDRIFVALGSNLGDRFAAIESACRTIDESADMRVVATSALFETEPMYLEDQNRFLNGVCQVCVHLILRLMLD